MTYTCPECGATSTGPTRIYAMLFHMINAGELTVGEARQELAQGHHNPEVRELLAGWSMAVRDRGWGDDYRAGMEGPEL